MVFWLLLLIALLCAQYIVIFLYSQMWERFVQCSYWLSNVRCMPWLLLIYGCQQWHVIMFNVYHHPHSILSIPCEFLHQLPTGSPVCWKYCLWH